jgi:hypothetical protein
MMRNRWGGPPGPQPTPWSACYDGSDSGTRASRADQGVRPTTEAVP